MIQSGDFERQDGTGGISIDGEKFPDEISRKSMIKSGWSVWLIVEPIRMEVSFFITIVEKCEWLE